MAEAAPEVGSSPGGSKCRANTNVSLGGCAKAGHAKEALAKVLLVNRVRRLNMNGMIFRARMAGVQDDVQISYADGGGLGFGVALCPIKLIYSIDLSVV